MAGSSRRTLISEMHELDSAYHGHDGVHIAHEMENAATYLRNGKAPKRRGFEVLKKGEFAGNFDASGIPGTNTFAHGHVIRNFRGTLVDFAFGKAVDPCKGNSSGFMEIFSYSKMIERVDPRKCPVLEARCDNELSINVLNGSKPYDGFKHARHYKNIMKPIRVIEKAKYRKGK
ncbi:uncharacterized protein LOC113282699 [Papaver somniferum]|nr:uncharacterized protein LOC113282699 [Papaver somniferum]